MRKRQDLGYLGEVASTSRRYKLPAEKVFPQPEVAAVLAEFKSSQVKVNQEKNGDLDPKIFSVEMESMPVCGVMDSMGVPIHPPSRNNSGGRVCVDRKMGSTPGLPLGLAQVAEVYGDEVLDRPSVYTSGTWKGFVNRLNQQMGRKTKPLYETLAPLGKKVSAKVALDRLDRLMPRDKNPNWPGVHTNIADALLDGIKVTANSSAGAPYWRNKGECMDHIVDVGLPLIVHAIKNNTLQQLWRENPEFFLCEVKNKLDRYDIDKLEDKTRPYTCVPAHWAFLFSMLSQGFQETLKVFDSGEGSNAYGFSSTNGGLTRMVEWMHTADERGKVCCYGDDTCLVVKKPDGVWRVDPDFKQMDGSIDAEDVDLTIRWILRHLKRDSGEDKVPHFWQAVATQWKKMATSPNFILDGTKIYSKKNPHGLMTGVPGTTLFDTVKSVLSWDMYLDQCQMNGWDPLDGKRATKVMKSWGLIIKPGTWKPARVPESRNGQLITDHKFLGVQIKAVHHRGKIIHIPTIPEAEALAMLVVQKDSPWEKESRTVKSRKLYDRMRGLKITCGFSLPRIGEAIHNVVNELPPEIILMQTQIEGGARPEHITLQDFNYPDSSGFPTTEFCLNLYGGFEKTGWLKLFPDMDETLEMMKNERRTFARRLRYELGVAEDKTLGVIMVDEPDRPLDPALDEAVAFEPVKQPEGKPNVRSKAEIVKTSTERVTAKYVPKLGESILRYIKEVGGVTTVGALQERFSVNPLSLWSAAGSWGFYMLGDKPEDLVSLNPVVTPLKTKQNSLPPKWEEKKNLVDAGATSRREALLKLKAGSVVRTAPELVLLDVAVLEGLPKMEQPRDDLDALAKINQSLTTLYGGMRWRSLEVRPRQLNPVGVQLLVGPQRDEVVAEAWSCNKKLAQAYIARTVLDLNGFPTPPEEFVVRAPPPIPAADPKSWAAEVEVEEARDDQNAFYGVFEKLASPYKRPKILDLKEVDTFNQEPPLDLVQRHPELDRDALNRHWVTAVARTRDRGDAQLEFSRLLQERSDSSTGSSTSSGVGMSPPHSPSKRSHKSAEWKRKRNRRVLERRKELRDLGRSAPHTL